MNLIVQIPDDVAHRLALRVAICLGGRWKLWRSKNTSLVILRSTNYAVFLASVPAMRSMVF